MPAVGEQGGPLTTTVKSLSIASECVSVENEPPIDVFEGTVIVHDDPPTVRVIKTVGSVITTAHVVAFFFATAVTVIGVPDEVTTTFAFGVGTASTEHPLNFRLPAAVEMDELGGLGTTNDAFAVVHVRVVAEPLIVNEVVAAESTESPEPVQLADAIGANASTATIATKATQRARGRNFMRSHFQN